MLLICCTRVHCVNLAIRLLYYTYVSKLTYLIYLLIPMHCSTQAVILTSLTFLLLFL